MEEQANPPIAEQKKRNKVQYRTSASIQQCAIRIVDDKRRVEKLEKAARIRYNNVSRSGNHMCSCKDQARNCSCDTIHDFNNRTHLHTLHPTVAPTHTHTHTHTHTTTHTQPHTHASRSLSLYIYTYTSQSPTCPPAPPDRMVLISKSLGSI